MSHRTSPRARVRLDRARATALTGLTAAALSVSALSVTGSAEATSVLRSETSAPAAPRTCSTCSKAASRLASVPRQREHVSRSRYKKSMAIAVVGIGTSIAAFITAMLIIALRLVPSRYSGSPHDEPQQLVQQ